MFTLLHALFFCVVFCEPLEKENSQIGLCGVRIGSSAAVHFVVSSERVPVFPTSPDVTEVSNHHGSISKVNIYTVPGTWNRSTAHPTS